MTGTLDMTDVSMTESPHFIEPLTDVDCTDPSSINPPRIGVKSDTVPETELMTRHNIDLGPLGLNLTKTIKILKTESSYN